MELSLITNDHVVAQGADSAGVERIFIDLERLGKQVRKNGRELFQSTHVPGDVSRMSTVLRRSKLMVRIDPPHDETPRQIDFVIRSGADYVMLPFFQTVDQARRFVDRIAGRAHAVLLVETAEAVAVLDQLTELPGLSEVHVGLNDLSISLNQRFLFDLLSDGTVNDLCRVLRDAQLPFGFGGIGSLSRSDLPVNPDLILAYQVCQGATRGWLGRTFRETPTLQLPHEIQQLRNRILYWQSSPVADRGRMERELFSQINAASGRSATAPRRVNHSETRRAA